QGPAQMSAQDYPVLRGLPAYIMPPPDTPTREGDGVGLICTARYSRPRSNEEIATTYDDNDVIIQKFERDYISPIRILKTGSVVWHDRQAWVPLPWAVHSTAEVQDVGRGLNNHESDARFFEFFKESRNRIMEF